MVSARCSHAEYWFHGGCDRTKNLSSLETGGWRISGRTWEGCFLYNAGTKGDAYAILKSVVIHANGRLLCKCDTFSVQDVEAIVQTVHIKQYCLGCSHFDVTDSSQVTRTVAGGRFTTTTTIVLLWLMQTNVPAWQKSECPHRKEKHVPVAASVEKAADIKCMGETLDITSLKICLKYKTLTTGWWSVYSCGRQQCCSVCTCVNNVSAFIVTTKYFGFAFTP